MKLKLTAFTLMSAVLLVALAYFKGYEAGRREISRVALSHANDSESASNRLVAIRANTLLTQSLSWASIESADYRNYIKNMKLAGVPEQTIFDIIKADIDLLFAPKLQLLLANQDQVGYWNTSTSGISELLVLKSSIKELVEEKIRLIRELTGISPEYQLEYDAAIEALTGRYGFVDPERRQLLIKIERNLDNRENTTGIPPGMAAHKQEAAFDAEREKLLRAVLSNAEWAEWELRYSRSARTLKIAMNGFPLTKDEYDALFLIQRGDDLAKRDLLITTEPSQLSEEWRPDGPSAERLESALGQVRYRAFLEHAKSFTHD
jgi:hypothetical protein